MKKVITTSKSTAGGVIGSIAMAGVTYGVQKIVEKVLQD